jgi:hypothetical protein
MANCKDCNETRYTGCIEKCHATPYPEEVDYNPGDAIRDELREVEKEIDETRTLQRELRDAGKLDADVRRSLRVQMEYLYERAGYLNDCLDRLP